MKIATEYDDLIEQQIAMCFECNAGQLEGLIEGYKERLQELIIERAWMETCVLIAERESEKRIDE